MAASCVLAVVRVWTEVDRAGVTMPISEHARRDGLDAQIVGRFDSRQLITRWKVSNFNLELDQDQQCDPPRLQTTWRVFTLLASLGTIVVFGLLPVVPITLEPAASATRRAGISSHSP